MRWPTSHLTLKRKASTKQPADGAEILISRAPLISKEARTQTSRLPTIAGAVTECGGNIKLVLRHCCCRYLELHRPRRRLVLRLILIWFGDRDQPIPYSSDIWEDGFLDCDLHCPSCWLYLERWTNALHCFWT